LPAADSMLQSSTQAASSPKAIGFAGGSAARKPGIRGLPGCAGPDLRSCSTDSMRTMRSISSLRDASSLSASIICFRVSARRSPSAADCSASSARISARRPTSASTSVFFAEISARAASSADFSRAVTAASSLASMSRSVSSSSARPLTRRSSSSACSVAVRSRTSSWTRTSAASRAICSVWSASWALTSGSLRRTPMKSFSMASRDFRRSASLRERMISCPTRGSSCSALDSILSSFST
jgi:hypothetical protein